MIWWYYFMFWFLKMYLYIWLLFWWSNQSLARYFMIWKFKFATAVIYISYFVYCICCIIVYVCCTNSAPISHVFKKKKFFFFHFQSSFTDIAKVLSEFFRDLDIVPSDVIVGLVLLRKRQQLLRLRTIHQVRVLTMTSGF